MSSHMTATEVANRAPLGARTDSFAFWWLIAMAVLVAIMVLIGGVTRLTGSGLSMVEWRPLMGTPAAVDGCRMEPCLPALCRLAGI